MMVRAKDDIYRMADLKGKKIGISKSMNKIKNDWWRIQEHQGIELMLRMNGMTMDDIELVEFPYADDWYNLPEMMKATMELSIDLWLARDHKRDLAFRPLETALEKGIIDAMYMQTKPLQQVSEATGKFAAIEDLSRYPDWRLQVANIPAAITCTDVMAKEHPELAVTFMKGMIRVGRWANQNKYAAAEILDQQTFYRDIEHTYQGIRDVDLVPNLSPLNLAAVEIGKNFMLSHGYIKNDFDVYEVGRAGVPGAGGERTAGRRMEEENHCQASQDGRTADRTTARVDGGGTSSTVCLRTKVTNDASELEIGNANGALLIVKGIRWRCQKGA